MRPQLKLWQCLVCTVENSLTSITPPCMPTLNHSGQFAREGKGNITQMCVLSGGRNATFYDPATAQHNTSSGSSSGTLRVFSSDSGNALVTKEDQPNVS
jgi:hypothetical protein